MKSLEKLYDTGMRRFFKYFLILLGIALYSEKANATHIVGGELYYQCLGNDQYRITLNVYRDCYNGVPPFDDPAWVGVFDASGNLLDTIAMPFIGKSDTLLNDDICLYVPPSVCVERYSYTTVVTLPYIAGGYTLAYQRCCRNQTIVNIINPSQTGATYTIRITEDALKDCNSSPQFKGWPPIFICRGKPIIFDHSAYDSDGDSLVYVFCTPFVGGIYNVKNQPIPPFAPPYDTVVWKKPYSNANLLGGTDPLKVDHFTGLITGTPPTLGQFVVGIRVEEYRNGKLYSMVKRDFQYNVVECGKIEALWLPESFNVCDSLAVQLENNSTMATDFKWFYRNINKPGSKDELFSTEKNPKLIVPEYGSYAVKLVAEPLSSCSDTLEQIIHFKKNTLHADFGYQVIDCIDSITIQLLDQSHDSTDTVVKWDWQVTNNMNADTLNFTEQNPKFTLHQSSKVKVRLIAETQFGCNDTIIKEFQANILQLDSLLDTVKICKLDTVNLNPKYFKDYSYTWSPVTGLIPPVDSIPNPWASPLTTTTYTMVYTDSTNLCHVSQDITVLVLRSIDSLDFDVSIPYCQDSINIAITNVQVYSATGTGQVSWYWELTSPHGTQTSTDKTPIFSIPGSGWVTIKVIATTEDSCSYEKTKSFQANTIPKNPAADTVRICIDECVHLYPGADTMLIYDWVPPGGLDDPTSPNPLACPDSSTIYFVNYTDTVGLCIVHDSVLVMVNDTMVDFEFDIRCNGLTVQFINTSTPGIIHFFWEFGDPANSKSQDKDPVFTYPGPGTYKVLLYTTDDWVCRDSIEKIIVLDSLPNKADFDYQYEECENYALVHFFDKSTSKYAKIIKWTWTVDGVLVSNEQNPTIKFDKVGKYKVCLIIETDEGGCMDTLCKIIDINYINNTCIQQINACLEEYVPLNPGGDSTYTYEWFPCENLSDCNGVNPIATYPFTSDYYTVKISLLLPNGDTCITYDTITIIKDFVYGEVMNDTTICKDSITLHAKNLINVATIEWYKVPAIFLGMGNDLPIKVTESGKYYAVFTSPLGCKHTDTLMVTKLSGPIPQIDATPLSFCEPTAIQLTTGANPSYTYQWSPPELFTNPTIFNPTSLPIDKTTIFTVVVNDTLGCEGSASITVTHECPICDEPFIFVPNAFSPNADGKNDVLYVRGESVIDGMDFVIYNRWGQEVFRSKDLNTGWDGTFNGKELSPDVYGYYLKARCFDGTIYTNQGNINLLR